MCSAEGNATVSDAYLQTEVRRDTPVWTQWYMEDEWSGNYIFHPVPLCLCSPYTHYTTGNTCNASRRDFWQRGGGNNFRKPALLLFFFPLLSPPPAPLSGSTLLCQPSIWWLETTHFITVTRHDGPARPQPLDLFPALCSSTPPSERQHVGRLASLLICHGWTAREAQTPFPPLFLPLQLCRYFWERVTTVSVFIIWLSISNETDESTLF